MKITLLIKIYSFICYILLANAMFAQDIAIDAIPDTTNIRIGEQTNLLLKAVVPENIQVYFPVTADSLMWAIEVLDRTAIDSSIANGMKAYEQLLTITSFDSGYHAIPPLPFAISGNNGSVDSIFSEAFLLGVHTVAVDTTQAIKDIKAPIQAPLSFAEVFPYILLVLLLLILSYAGYYFWKRRQAKPKEEKKAPEKPKEPAHIIAFRELEQLRAEKIWENGDFKEYHSQLTEIVRRYIENRYAMPALEQTTDEIIRGFEYAGIIEQELVEKLAHTFRLADLVKFAKMYPLPEENERSMKQAFQFVNDTKMEQAPKEETVSNAS